MSGCASLSPDRAKIIYGLPARKGSVCMKSNLVKEILSWVVVIAAAVIIAFLLTQFIIVNATVPSGSMENTIHPGDRLFGLRLTYVFSEPRRGDIAVFKYPVYEALIDEVNDTKEGRQYLKSAGIKHTNYIKRVIGLPGETVEIRDAKIYINGSDEPLDEPYLKEEWLVRNDGYTFEIPEGCYLMLGDNRNNSSDARYWAECAVKEFTLAGSEITAEAAWDLSFVRKKQLLGKAYVRYWPLNKISSLY